MGLRDNGHYARLFCGAAVFVMAGAAGTAQAQSRIDIPAQPLASALTAFSVQSDRTVIASASLTGAKVTRGVSGVSDPDVALRRVLEGTGLSYTRSDGAYMIVRAERPSARGAATVVAAPESGEVVEALIVTAQKREEDIQDVPIAISAFSQKDLEAQKIETGGDLLKAIPNVTFSKNNFSGYNFSIRGIGTKAISVTTDPGVAVSFNGTTLIRNRLFEQEYFDIERVEVLRGPQGTLYGRNATSGVINVISAKPDLNDFSGMVKAEVGNYQSRRAVGMINIPILADKLAIRFAGSATIRDGYNINLYDNTRVDGRNLWSGRVTVGFEPFEGLRGNLLWEHFDESDNRSRTGKQLCTHDSGPDSVGGYDLTPYGYSARGYFNQGCLPGSLYDEKAFGTPNGTAIPFVIALQTFGLGFDPNIGEFVWPIKRGSDPYGNTTQSHDLRALYSQIKPVYSAQADIYELNFDWDLGPSLTLSSQTAYNKDRIYSTQDFNRYTTLPVIADTSNLIGGLDGTADWSPFRPLAPGGYFDDPQLGKSNTIVGQDLSRARSQQFSQEFRLQSDFNGPINFSAGINYTRYRTVEDYYVFFNGITLAAVAVVNNFVIGHATNPTMRTTNPDCSIRGGGTFSSPDAPDGMLCTPIEQNAIGNIQDVGHNYFLSRNPYKLDSRAGFGEVYWQATQSVKVTAGLRFTDDKKIFTPIPSQTLLSDPARLDELTAATGDQSWANSKGFPLFSFASGLYPALPDIEQQWRKFTGRLGVDWRPQTAFTDQTMVYAFYSRGYKGGGANPPRIGLNYPELERVGYHLAPSAPPDFRPEFVNAFEVGTKNTLLSGSLVLNANAFFYDYKDYQVSKIVDRSANNENFDAKIWGLELESVWQPTRSLRFNASLGYLDTELAQGSKSIDIMNRTAGHADWMQLKPAVVFTSNCIAPVHVVTLLVADSIQNDGPDADFRRVQALCPGGDNIGGNYTGKETLFGSANFLPDSSTYDPAEHPEANYGAGFDTDVSGNELPNSPHFTVSLGGQYSVDFLEGWRATVRGDFYWQSQQWARIYELPLDKLHAWKNGNLRVTFERPDDELEVEIYAKNIFDDTPITDTFTNSDDTALTTNIFVLDPRIIGLSIKKGF